MRPLSHRGGRAVRVAEIKRYVADVGWPTAAYFASVIVAALLTKHMAEGWPRLLVAALPLPAILWMARAELARLRRRDELRQRIELEAMTIAFSASFCLIAMLTFLHLFAAFEVGIASAAVLMAACWSGAHVWVRARYRYCWLQPDGEEDRR